MNFDLIGGMLSGAVLLLMGQAMHGIYRLIQSNRALAADEKAVKITHSLADLPTRERLEQLFVRIGLKGDGYIRDGKVSIAPSADQLPTLAAMLHTVLATANTTRDKNLYLKVNDDPQSLAATDLDLDIVCDLLNLVERTWEDRQKSRSMYRGITDEEITNMSRAAMANHYSRAGNAGKARMSLDGDYDHSETFAMVTNGIKIFMQIKGANL